MRYKFRAWHKELKDYYKVEKIIFNYDLTIKGVWVFKNDDIGSLYFGIDYIILEQYTGLKDKNGVDIYEGDIVKGLRHYNSKQYERTGEIKWNNQHSWYYLNVFALNTNRLSAFKNIEVIGNIHENKELLDND